MYGEGREDYQLGWARAIIGKTKECEEWFVFFTETFATNTDYSREDAIHMLDTQHWMNEQLNEAGWDNFWGDLVEVDEGVFEIVGPLWGWSSKSWTDCGYEHDGGIYFNSDTKVHKMNDKEIASFKEHFPEEWLTYEEEHLGVEHEDHERKLSDISVPKDMINVMRVEGNSGCDFFEICQSPIMRTKDQVKITVGHCCVYEFNKVVPVEFLTCLFHYMNMNDITPEKLFEEWQDKDYKKKLMSRIEDVRF